MEWVPLFCPSYFLLFLGAAARVVGVVVVVIIVDHGGNKLMSNPQGKKGVVLCLIN
jgi:hypothetical protein